MDIMLKGNNGEKVVIPIEDLIQKYWSDENSKPNRIEMSATVKDETILAAMTICDEKEENYLSVDLESRNEKFDTEALWCSLEAPNTLNPFVTGYLYSGNNETESDDWLLRIVDGYKGTVKYDETLTSFTVVSCEPNRLSDPVFLWDCSDIHVVGNVFDGELSKREQEVSCTYTKCLALAKSIDTLQLCYGPYFNSLKVESLWSKAFELMDDVTRSEIVEDLKLFQRAWRKYKEEKPVKDAQKILDAISELFGEEVTSK